MVIIILYANIGIFVIKRHYFDLQGMPGTAVYTYLYLVKLDYLFFIVIVVSYLFVTLIDDYYFFAAIFVY